MIYLTKGKLPWQGLQGGKDKMEKYNMITEMKFNTSIDELCFDLPSKLPVTLPLTVEFTLFYSYCRALDYDQKPDYGYLRRLMRDLIYKESFNR